MEKNKSCSTCKHYFAHYIKKDSRLVRTACGSCAVIKKPQYVNCGFWEQAPNESVKSENIKIVFNKILIHLDGLALILDE